METVTAFLIVILVALAGAVVTVAWLWRTIEQSQSAYRDRLDKQEVETDDLRRQIVELREGRIADHLLLQEWITYARRLGQMLREATGQEPPVEPQAPPRSVAVDAGRLARAIAAKFTGADIDTLAFELGLDGRLSGEAVPERAVSLVKVAQQRGLLLRLVELCRRERPEGGF